MPTQPSSAIRGSLPEFEALETRDLRPLQLFFLAAAVFVVSAAYGSLLPLLPVWLSEQMPLSNATDVARHVGFLSGAYTAGVLLGAPLWGLMSDRLGQPRILIVGLIGYVSSLLILLLVPTVGSLWVIYTLRAGSGLFVAAVVAVVPALVAAHTPSARRARRFAWLGAASLLGFLSGPGLNAVANVLAEALTNGPAPAALQIRIVIGLSAFLGASMMLGLALTLPARDGAPKPDAAESEGRRDDRIAALGWLSLAVTFALSGFEVGIVLQGELHVDLSTQQVALMFAECSLVMLSVNAALFFTSILDKVPSWRVIAVGSLVGIAGLAILASHHSHDWMYVGVSLTSAGTGLVLPVISFLAAGVPRRALGTTMGWLAAAAGLGQTLGSATGGWLFGAFAQHAFGWLALPLSVVPILMLLHRQRWSHVTSMSVTTSGS